MNEHALLHKPDSNFCFPVGAKQIIIRLRVMKGEPFHKVSVLHACKYEFHIARKETMMVKKYSDRYFDYYETKLDLDDVRFAYIFALDTNEGRFYFSEDGVTKEYDFNLGFYNFFQLPYISKEDVHETVEWMKSAVFYQIFVDRFLMANEQKDKSYINLSWGERPSPKSFAGGDLKGIIKKLDYIVDLGANTIYLTPIFKSISNHKYDTIDYKEIDPQFGTKEDLKELVIKAHEKGVRIVLDAVFNHCSNQMMQFQDVLNKGKESEYYDWFFIYGDTVTTNPCNYECFGACEYMPKLNTSKEEVRKFLIDIACYYIKEFDIDGWRLDVADEISHDFWRLFRKEVKKIREDCVIIGENWHDAYPFLMGDQFDSIMNYSFTKACLDYFAFDRFRTQDFVHKLNEILVRNKQGVNEMMLNLLDSHDTHRFFTEINKDKNKLLAAIAIATCFLGVPCIYYGTEICMEGGYDPDSRRTFEWEESNWDFTVRSTIRKVLALKKEASLQEGEIKMEAVGEVFLLERYLKTESITLLYNAGCLDEELDSLYPSSEKQYNMVASNGYQNGVLGKGGFVILKTLFDNLL